MANWEWRLSSHRESENGESLHAESKRVASCEWVLPLCGQCENGELRIETFFVRVPENGELRMDTFFMQTIWEWQIDDGDVLRASALRMVSWQLRLPARRQWEDGELTIDTLFVRMVQEWWIDDEDSLFMRIVWECRIENGDYLHPNGLRVASWQWRLSSCAHSEWQIENEFFLHAVYSRMSIWE